MDITKSLTNKEISELRIKCLELARDISRDDSVYTILVRAREMYNFISSNNDAEIDVVIELYQEKKWRFNQYFSRS